MGGDSLRREVEYWGRMKTVRRKRLRANTDSARGTASSIGRNLLEYHQ